MIKLRTIYNLIKTQPSHLIRQEVISPSYNMSGQVRNLHLLVLRQRGEL